jgi:poly(A) polymerase
MKLEFVDTLTLAHPFVKGFDQVHYCLTEQEIRAVAQGEISDAVKIRTAQDIEGKEGASAVHSTTFYIGLAIELKPGASESVFTQHEHIGCTADHPYPCKPMSLDPAA